MKNFDKMGVYTRNGLEFDFNFHTSLRAVDKMRFVSNVTDLVVGDNYYSVIRDIIFNFNIIIFSLELHQLQILILFP